MAIEQYIVRELKQDIKLLIKKVDNLEQKLEEAHPTKKTESEETPDVMEQVNL
jgi:hypothetical protein